MWWYFVVYWLVAGIIAAGFVYWEDGDCHFADKTAPMAFVMGFLMVPMFLFVGVVIMLPCSLIKRAVLWLERRHEQ